MVLVSRFNNKVKLKNSVLAHSGTKQKLSVEKSKNEGIFIQ